MSGKENAAGLSALFRSYENVKRGKRDVAPAIRFGVNALEGLCLLKWSLEDRSYAMGNYSCFAVERPVHRDVKTCAFKDKIVLGALCKSVLWDTTSPHLIRDNYASRAGMGTHDALKRLEANMHSYYINHGNEGYVLKMDARKYFYNLRHDIVREQLEALGLDDWTMWLCDVILNSSNAGIKEGVPVGLPIGNETSQVFAVMYLNGVDHFVKDQCGIKYYGRYMDDSYIIHRDKEYLENLLKDLRRHYAELGLELNQKTQIAPLKNGVKFLGMHYYLTETGRVVKRLKPENIRYARVHIRENAERVVAGTITEKNYWQRFEAWDNHASYADAKRVRRKMHYYAKEALRNAYSRKRRELGEVCTDGNPETGGAH